MSVYMDAYVDGVFATDDVSYGSSYPPPNHNGKRDKIVFGAKLSDGNFHSPDFGNCILDDMAIFEYVLSESEVTAVFYAAVTNS